MYCMCVMRMSVNLLLNLLEVLTGPREHLSPKTEPWVPIIPVLPGGAFEEQWLGGAGAGDLTRKAGRLRSRALSGLQSTTGCGTEQRLLFIKPNGPGIHFSGILHASLSRFQLSAVTSVSNP